MDKSISTLDWSLVQAFLAVAETGSLSAAARDLDASQPTLGRQIKAMETQLAAELFHRNPRGLSLTDTGAALVAPARQMRDAMHQIVLTSAGQTDRLAGPVRITASAATSIYHLPQIIADIRQAEPEIAIELVPSDESRNLLYREADIALRMYRPTQLDLITRHIGDLALGMFASKDYVARRGTPQTPDDMLTHDFVGYDENPAIWEGFAQAGFDVGRDFFKTRCDDHIAYLELLRAGCGIGFAQCSIAAKDPDVQELDLQFPIPPLPIWLTAHEAMRQTPRIRRVWDLLADGLGRLVS
ncbi:LysR family transcriptional regulator [Yoonia sp. 208BN28-4]|uniref:LysR family transcriptional regulator n=1 Tax=Yoonia sp. 208BN28-4 TaxID=3126505 RepID=UPI0030B08CF8